METNGRMRMFRRRGYWCAAVDDARLEDARGTHLLTTRLEEDMPAELVERELRRRHPRARIHFEEH